MKRILNSNAVICLLFAVFGLNTINPVGADDLSGAQFFNNAGFCGTFVLPLGTYNCIEYAVTTGDGYKLGVQRMSSKSSFGAKKGPVFLYHGIMQGGDVWVLNPPRESLAFILADAGYDVFVGNTRSSTFSYGHIRYTRNDDAFWDWSWDDLVSQDLPSMVQFVYAKSYNRPINYIGFSQGAMTALAGFTDDNVRGMVRKAVLLSPVSYLRHLDSPMLSVASWLFVDQILLASGVSEFRVDNGGGKKWINMVCTSPDVNCVDDLLSMVTGKYCCLNESRKAYYNQFEMQPTSMRNLAQMAQMVRSGSFQKYNYGVVQNMKRYWSVWPPSYDLSSIPSSFPMMLVHGGKDGLIDTQDFQHLLDDLKCQPQVVFIPQYAHGDFVMSPTAANDVYHNLIAFLG